MNQHLADLCPLHRAALDAYRKCLERERYSRQTQKNYCNNFIRFLKHFAGRDLSGIGSEEVSAYLNQRAVEHNLSAGTSSVTAYAIRYYYDNVQAADQRRA